MTTRESLIQNIVDKTSEHWATRSAPLLLSQLGPALRTDGIEYKTIISPLSMKQFIDLAMEDKVKIVKHPDKSKKIGVIPINEAYEFPK